jgi:hypothetical protein
MSLISEELERVRQLLRENIDAENPRYPFIVSEYRELGSTWSFDGWSRTQLRFDFEGGKQPYEKYDAIDRAISFMETDLEELIVDGDVTKNHDAFLKSLNGSKVRGVDGPEQVWIPSCMVIPEHVKTQERYDYTIYCVLYVKWPEQSST